MSAIRRYGFFILVNFMVLLSVGLLFEAINVLLFQGQLSSYTGGLLLWCALMGMVGSFISLMFSKTLAKRMYRLKMVDAKTAAGTEREILEMVNTLARSARLKVLPEVGIYESPEMNAFATGPSKNNSLVAISSGLLRSMNRDQVEGVLAHEVAHIANGDMVTMSLLQGVINTFIFFFSYLVANFLTGDERGGSWKRFLLIGVLETVFGILGSIPLAYYSRGREFRADKGGARYAGKAKMIGALQALQRQVGIPAGEGIEPAKDAFASFKISKSPRRAPGLTLFSTHPSLELRIERLERGN